MAELLTAPPMPSGSGALTELKLCTAKGVSLTGTTIWVEDWGIHPQPHEILASPRVGVDYAGEHARWPWRYRLTGFALPERRLSVTSSQNSGDVVPDYTLKHV